MNYDLLKHKAKKLRQKTFKAFVEKGEAHLGGSFSIIEMLIVLYENVLNKEDKFILSKSHASFPLCILLQQRGLSPPITTHLEMDTENGIHCTTGSLGHGLPIATGMAIARKLMKKPGIIYVMVGDGECQEGTTWESLLIAAAHKLDNLVLLVDYNKMQALSKLEEALPLGDLTEKFKAFNWSCSEVDGHSFDELLKAFKKTDNHSNPRAIIAHTIKGKGIKPFENDPGWHARKIKENDLKIGQKELSII